MMAMITAQYTVCSSTQSMSYGFAMSATLGSTEHRSAGQFTRSLTDNLLVIMTPKILIEGTRLRSGMQMYAGLQQGGTFYE